MTCRGLICYLIPFFGVGMQLVYEAVHSLEEPGKVVGAGIVHQPVRVMNRQVASLAVSCKPVPQIRRQAEVAHREVNQLYKRIARDGLSLSIQVTLQECFQQDTYQSAGCSRRYGQARLGMRRVPDGRLSTPGSTVTRRS